MPHPRLVPLSIACFLAACGPSPAAREGEPLVCVWSVADFPPSRAATCGFHGPDRAELLALLEARLEGTPGLSLALDGPHLTVVAPAAEQVVVGRLISRLVAGEQGPAPVRCRACRAA